MNNRIVLRSLVTSDGCLTAMDDGNIIWRPTHGSRQQTKLESLATVLLAFKSSNNRINSIVMGDNRGGIIHLSIPSLEVINRFSLEGESIRSICSASESTHRLLVACQSGSIWMVGDQVPSRKVHLFHNDGPVTSIRVSSNKEIHLQSGWQRRVIDFTGCELSYHDTSDKFKKKDEIRAIRRARLETQQYNSNYPTTIALDSVTA